jgi:hypothetical protein
VTAKDIAVRVSDAIVRWLAEVAGQFAHRPFSLTSPLEFRRPLARPHRIGFSKDVSVDAVRSVSK